MAIPISGYHQDTYIGDEERVINYGSDGEYVNDSPCPPPYNSKLVNVNGQLEWQCVLPDCYIDGNIDWLDPTYKIELVNGTYTCVKKSVYDPPRGECPEGYFWSDSHNSCLEITYVDLPEEVEVITNCNSLNSYGTGKITIPWRGTNINKVEGGRSTTQFIPTPYNNLESLFPDRTIIQEIIDRTNISLNITKYQLQCTGYNWSANIMADNTNMYSPYYGHYNLIPMCNVKSVRYITFINGIVLPVFTFQFTASNNILGNHEYIVGHNGQLCRIIIHTEIDKPTDTQPPTQPMPCPSGFVKDKFNNCVKVEKNCGKGFFKAVNGDCVKLPDACPTGHHLDISLGYCVPDTPPNPPGSGYIYSDISDNIIDKRIVTTPLWECDQVLLSNIQVKNTDTCSNHLDVYNVDDNCEHVQYCIAYCDYEGKGDKDLGGLDHETVSKALYSQYANILLPSNQNKFIINGEEQDYVYVIDIKRRRYNDYVDPGNWQLSLAAVDFDVFTSVNDLLSAGIDWNGYTFIDSSVLENDELELSNKSYDIIIGTIEKGAYTQPIGPDTLDTRSYGLFYPAHGILVFSGKMLDDELGFYTNRVIDNHGNNTLRLYKAIEQITTNNITDDSGDPLGFYGRGTRIYYDNIYFLNLGTEQFNFSNNPTYVEDKRDGFVIKDFRQKEMAYFTSIGLYNNNKDLLAIGKLASPMLNKSTKSGLFKVRVGL